PVPAGAALGVTKMRIRGGDDTNDPTLGQACGASGSSYGEGEDYLVNIVATTPCAGTPPAITAASTASTACVNAAFTLSSTGVAAGTTGLTYQWQSRTGTAAFTNLPNATAATYTVASQTAATDYRLVVTCTASTQTSTSNVVAVGQSNFLSCYVTPVISTGTNEYIRSVSVNGASGFTNATNANSANGYGDFTANTALTATLAKGSSYPLTVIVQANNVGSQGALWIDYNHSGTFDADEYFQFGSSSATATAVTFTPTLAIPNTAATLTGATRLRLRWRNGPITASDAQVSGAGTWFGETEDYLVTLTMPLAGTAAQGAAGLALFPNPAHSAATLTGAEAGAPVQLLDVLGRVVLTTKADATGQAALALPASLTHGVYLVRTGTRTIRLVLE
ncbi:MAG: T9SS type A sorting domain-containing protein, partial [Hymenobacter sp.]